jgi:hypothetical protein
MHCPDCGGEYRPGITMCPTCEVALTEEKGAGGGVQSAFGSRGPRLVPTLVDLIGYVDEIEAREVRKKLKAAGIACELVIRDADGEEEGDEFWIRVPGAKAHEAAELLHVEEVLSDSACPSCGAHLEEDEDCPACTPE